MWFRVNIADNREEFIKNAEKYENYSAFPVNMDDVDELYGVFDDEGQRVGYITVQLYRDRVSNVGIIKTKGGALFIRECVNFLEWMNTWANEAMFYCIEGGEGQKLIEFLSKHKDLYIKQHMRDNIGDKKIIVYKGGWRSEFQT